MWQVAWIVLFLWILTQSASAQGGLQLALPIDCTLGADCFIQQYVDADPGPEARDYRCGTATYDAHDGTDFRVQSLEAAARGVAVLASATGTVKAVRDGVENRLIASRGDLLALSGRECGNGVIIDHGDGWETQYCHLKPGSIRVRGGDSVLMGAPLGLVGYSGAAQFAHVHLSLRRNGKVIDPFSGKEQDGTCGALEAGLSVSLWAEALRSRLAYADAAVIEAGFAAGPVTTQDAEQGVIAAPGAMASGLVFYVRLINMREGDGLRLTASGPEGFNASSEIAPLDRGKADYVAFAGRKLAGDRWAAGRYRGQVDVLRDGKVIGRREAAFDIP